MCLCKNIKKISFLSNLDLNIINGDSTIKYFYKKSLFHFILCTLMLCSTVSSTLACSKDFTTSTVRSMLTLKTPTPQNGQTHSNNSSAVADELSESI